MKTHILAAAILAAFLPPCAFPGSLDIAVVRFPDARDAGSLAAALASADLAALTDADRTRTGDPVLQSGAVLFSQSFPANPGDRFSTSTRIGGKRADVNGLLAGGRVEVAITISEGVRATLAGYERGVFRGAGSLPTGSVTILSLRESKVKAPRVVKGQAKMETGSVTTVVLAQFKP